MPRASPPYLQNCCLDFDNPKGVGIRDATVFVSMKPLFPQPEPGWILDNALTVHGLYMYQMYHSGRRKVVVVAAAAVAVDVVVVVVVRLLKQMNKGGALALELTKKTFETLDETNPIGKRWLSFF